MKKLLISIFIIFGAIFLAHSQELDSLISVLNNSKHDTTKCRILNIIIESVEEEELYNYNQQLKNIVEKNIKNTELNKLLKREYLIYKGIYLTNEGYISDLKSEFEKAINYLLCVVLL